MTKIEKDGFLCPKDLDVYFRYLDNSQIGELFLAIFIYERKGELPEWYEAVDQCLALVIAFATYKAFSDRMNRRYIDKVEKRIAAAKERWEIYNREILKSEGTKDAT